MAENLSKKPSKSILKNSSSFDAPDAKLPATNRPKAPRGSAKWDEMNIMATLHPPDKDYGHMKIDEPKTPYNYEGLGLDVDELDAETLAAKIREAEHETPKALRETDESEEDDDDTPEEKAAKKEFEQKRKKHYNEFYAVKLARKLLEKDEDEDEEEEGKDETLQQSNGGKESTFTPCKPPANPPARFGKQKAETKCKAEEACRTSNAIGKSGGRDGAEQQATSSGAKECHKSRRCGCMDHVRKM